MYAVRNARRVVKAIALAGVLAVTALVVPQSAVQPTDVSLVRIRHAQGVATGGPDVVWILAVGSDAHLGTSSVRFSIDYEFRSRLLGVMMGAMFDRAFRMFAEAFEKRADAVYGTA